eukprot:scaffold57378_cov61-Phaeocystis_antarctica.AAC.2
MSYARNLIILVPTDADDPILLLLILLGPRALPCSIVSTRLHRSRVARVRLDGGGGGGKLDLHAVHRVFPRKAHVTRRAVPSTKRRHEALGPGGKAPRTRIPVDARERAKSVQVSEGHSRVAGGVEGRERLPLGWEAREGLESDVDLREPKIVGDPKLRRPSVYAPERTARGDSLLVLRGEEALLLGDVDGAVLRAHLGGPLLACVRVAVDGAVLRAQLGGPLLACVRVALDGALDGARREVDVALAQQVRRVQVRGELLGRLRVGDEVEERALGRVPREQRVDVLLDAVPGLDEDAATDGHAQDDESAHAVDEELADGAAAGREQLDQHVDLEAQASSELRGDGRGAAPVALDVAGERPAAPLALDEHDSALAAEHAVEDPRVALVHAVLARGDQVAFRVLELIEQVAHELAVDDARGELVREHQVELGGDGEREAQPLHRVGAVLRRSRHHGGVHRPGRDGLGARGYQRLQVVHVACVIVACPRKHDGDERGGAHEGIAGLSGARRQLAMVPHLVDGPAIQVPGRRAGARHDVVLRVDNQLAETP